MIETPSDIVATVRRDLAQAHVNSRYYSDAEAGDWLAVMWGPNSLFLPLFRRLDLSDVVEIACGYGRHAAQFIDRAGQVTLTDINHDSISACRTRFAGRDNVACLVNSGKDLGDLESGRYSAVFSYDAMVHFEASDLIAYVFEVARILRPGGRALLHYSNFQGCPEGTYSDGPHWRNFFSEAMFRHFASRAGLRVIESKIMAWPPAGGVADLDALTLVEKA
ncbi:MAG TPA: class I SAM-dependent methyltransferase [Caulobacteraceae bacterium]|jgi:SAM-dependent methyltransferase